MKTDVTAGILGECEGFRGYDNRREHGGVMEIEMGGSYCDGREGGEGNKWGGSRSSSSSSRLSTTRLALLSVVAAGVQFGWALQFSLLTPYVQTIGVPHFWASFIWLCGPISGLVVQPCVGMWSDSCSSPWGRRRPFILAGTLAVMMALLLIGFSADVGHWLGDDVSSDTSFRPMACVVFVLGFWCLDLSNNTVQGPSRALLADLADPSQLDSANSWFSLWTAVGSVLGYSTGALGQWHRWLPFLNSAACGIPCANLKAAFLLAILFLSLCAAITLIAAVERPLHSAAPPHLSLPQQDQPTQPLTQSPLPPSPSSPHNSPPHVPPSSSISPPSPPSPSASSSSPPSRPRFSVWVPPLSTPFSASKGYRKLSTGEDSNEVSAMPHQQEDKAAIAAPSSGLLGLAAGFSQLPAGMWSVLLVMALSWAAWFPFLLFDTDWMGREVFLGSPNSPLPSAAALYLQGVQQGAFGLLLFSVVQGLTSAILDPLCRCIGSNLVWGGGNLLVFFCMIATWAVTFLAQKEQEWEKEGRGPGIVSAKLAALVIFSSLGVSFAITVVVPFSITATLTAGRGGGQGLSMGILNMAIVIPQMLVSFVVGPFDAFFGGGNEPAFLMASIFALFASFLSWQLVPSLKRYH